MTSQSNELVNALVEFDSTIKVTRWEYENPRAIFKLLKALAARASLRRLTPEWAGRSLSA